MTGENIPRHDDNFDPEGLDFDALLREEEPYEWDDEDYKQRLNGCLQEVFAVLKRHSMVPEGVDTSTLNIDNLFDLPGDKDKIEFREGSNLLAAILMGLRYEVEGEEAKNEEIFTCIGDIGAYYEDADKWLAVAEELFGGLPLSDSPEERTQQILLLTIREEEKWYRSQMERAVINEVAPLLEQIIGSRYGWHDNMGKMARTIVRIALQRFGTTRQREGLEEILKHDVNAANLGGISEEAIEQLVQETIGFITNSGKE